MSEIDTILNFDWRGLIYSVFLLICCLIAIYEVCVKFVDIIRKLRHLPNPKNDAQDLEIEKLKERAKDTEANVIALKEANHLILWDRLMHFGMNYIKAGHISYAERDLWMRQWECYHNKLGGNGNLNEIKEMINKLPLDETEPLLNRKGE